MSASYFTAAIPEPFQILGLTLKPLSLGRYRLLNRFGCAFASDSEATAGIGDLVLGLVICSCEVPEFLDLVESGKLNREVARWSRRICPCPILGRLPIIGRWWRGRFAFDILEKVGLFKRYIELGSVVPKYWDESDGTHGSGAHWSQSLEIVLRGELGWSEREINEEPLAKALEDYLKWAEDRGLVRLMTPEEIAQIEQAERNERLVYGT